MSDSSGDSSGVNKDNVPLMKAMSLEIERLEAELRSATQKGEGCMRQARVYKQVAEALTEERDALKQEAAVHKQEAEVLTWQLARAKETLAEKLSAEEFEKKECTVCLERPAHVAVVPCGHRCFCTHAECSARVSALRTCPL